MNWHTKTFSELTTVELYNLLQLRAEVFVVEQDCPYQDLDGKDRTALHLWSSDANEVITAYCRIIPAGISYPEPSIGRVVTAPNARKAGIGRALMQQAIIHIQQQWQGASIRISAQLYLESFYTSLGFETVSEPYMEDNIPHIEMLQHA